MRYDPSIPEPVSAAGPLVSLRPLVPADAPFVLRLLNDPDFLRHVGDRRVRSVAEARRYIVLGPMLSRARHGFGLDCLELPGTGEPVGMCGLSRRPGQADPEVGFALLPAYRGRGLAGAGLALVLRAARQQHGLRRVMGLVREDNAASVGVLLRAGFVPCGSISLQAGRPDALRFCLEFSGNT